MYPDGKNVVSTRARLFIGALRTFASGGRSLKVAVTLTLSCWLRKTNANVMKRGNISRLNIYDYKTFLLLH